METYIDQKHPLTGDPIRDLPYEYKSIGMVKDFIEEHYHGDYTLCFFDVLSNDAIRTIELDNMVSDIFPYITDIVGIVSSLEHTFVHWVSVNSMSDSYVIGVDFTMGNFGDWPFYHYDVATKTIKERTFHA